MQVRTHFKITALMQYINPVIIKYKKKNNISHEKYVELTKRDLEIMADMTFDEIMELSKEEYNKVLKRGAKEPFIFELAQDGYRYFSYKNLRLSKYLDDKGEIDREKVESAYQNNICWKALDNIVAFRDNNGISYKTKELVWEEKYTHLKKYFPGVTRMRVNDEKKHILMEFHEIELDHLSMLDSLLSVRGRHWEDIGDNDECRHIKKALDELVKIGGVDLDNPYEFYRWSTFTMEGLNYVLGMTYISMGSQNYLNYIIDNIEGSNDKEFLKQFTISSFFIRVNPIANNGTVWGSTTFCVKYQDKSLRSKVIPDFYNYEKRGLKNPLPDLGYEVAYYDTTKKCFVPN